MATFLGRATLDIEFFKGNYLFHHSDRSYSMFRVEYLFLSRKEWKSSILWRMLFILTGYLGVIHFGNGMLIPNYDHFQRRLAAIHSLNGTVYFSDVKICRHRLLPAYFLSAYIRIPASVNQTSYQSSKVSRAASIILKWEQPFLLISCFFECKYFSAQLLLQRSLFVRIFNYSKHLVFRGRYFFHTTTF